MLPIFCIWAYWSIVIPIVVSHFGFEIEAYYSLIGVIPICLALSFFGYKIMKENYKEV